MVIKKKITGCSIRNANDLNTVCRLKRDNISTGQGSYIYADEKIVSIGIRKGGEFPSVTMSKKQFNLLIDWYNREQKFVRE